MTVGTPGNNGTWVTLEDSEGGELERNTVVDGSNWRTRRRSLSPGTYYVRVDSYQSRTGAYSLKLTAEGDGGDVEDDHGGVEDDHGDERSSATVVALPSETEGRFDSIDDVDYFRFEVAETRFVTIPNLGSKKYRAALFDSDGNFLASGGSGYVIRHSLPPGTYYVRFRGGWKTRYTLRLMTPTVESPDVAVEIPDAALRSALEDALGKSSGAEITRGEMAGVYHLNVTGVQDLTGIEYATNLYWLRLRGEVGVSGSVDGRMLSDLGPIAGLVTLGVLYISGNNDLVDVTPVAGLRWLEELALTYNNISDIAPLTDLEWLRFLDLWGNRVSAIPSLAGLRSLTDLKLDSVGMKNPDGTYDPAAHDERPSLDLSGLADSPRSLVSLNLLANKIVDVSPLAGLTWLRRLNLASNEIVDVSPLSGLTSLESLDLGFNRTLADMSPLAGLTSVTSLVLGGCATQVEGDISWVAELTSLQSLSFWDYGMVDLSPVSGLTWLSSLQVRDNNIADVSPLLHNTELARVDLRGNPLDKNSVETVIPLLLERGVEVTFTQPEEGEGEVIGIADAGLGAALRRLLRRGYGWGITENEVRQLRGLVASDFAIADLAGIEVAEHLRRLDLSANAIFDLAPLADLDVARFLFLDGNDIEDVGPLAGLSSLEALTLSNNAIEDVSPLFGLGSLRYLALDGNSLRELSQLPLSLAYLHLTNNRISDIGALSHLRLRELQLDGNSITSLAPLAGQSLRYLHFNRNQVADLSSLDVASLVELHAKDNVLQGVSPLLNAEKLLVADVRGNPLSEDAISVLGSLRERGTTVLAGEAVPYFPAQGPGRTGFVRVINRSDVAGEMFVEAVDDAGVRAGPVRLTLGAREAVHFNSADLENGNTRKGLDGGIGPPTAGNWRLALISPLDIEVLSYVRTEDGFVTAMHDMVADAVLPTFNPGGNQNQRSILRIVNTEAERARWTTGGYDDRGKWHPMAGSIEVRPGTALTLSAAALENAHGLGDGQGKWRLRVRGFPWFAMSLLESPTGHLTNLSTAPDHSVPLPDGGRLHRVPLFPGASAARVGFARVINRSDTPGQVAIEAVDDNGTRFGPVSLELRPRQTMHFNSNDLETGNADKGLSGGVGVGDGDWRLELASTSDLQVLSYIRTADGFLTSMHDLAPRAEDGSLWVPFFNPGRNTNQVSSLRLMNRGEGVAEVTITGVDDAGHPSSDAVRVSIPSGAARTFTAAELEAGSAAGLSGALGEGEGKWRLRVAASDEVEAMSLLSLPTGHMTNLSTTPRHSAE